MLLAILVSAFEDIRAHKIIAARAVVFGWAGVIAVFAYGMVLMPWVAWVMALTHLVPSEWLRWPMNHAQFLSVSYLGSLVGGLLVGVSTQGHRSAMLLLFLMSVLAALAGSAATLELTPLFPREFHPLAFLAIPGSVHHWRLGFLLAPIAIVIGGALGAGLSRTGASPPRQIVEFLEF